ncbi:methyltransferase [Aureimonas sp. AU12]|uniref:class I SAM-dependent methyltransferase n=1 Tax=Aureimonas sp. AU12 TaxID=1638161 RepID=UPI0007821581|nr:methyltransferase [Aureimonas sp. AU12]
MTPPALPSEDPRRRFVEAQTARLRSPHVPEIVLHLADEAHDLWLRTEEELEAIGLPPPFWAFAWAGGQGLARFVLDHPTEVRGARVLDFASGSGLVAIAAAMAGASHVCAVDVDPFALAATRLNAEANGVALDIRSADLVGSVVEADILLAGDVFYDRAFAERLAPWFDHLAEAGTRILVGDPGRAYLPRAHVTECAVYEVPVTRALEDADVKRTTVWRWMPPGSR